MKKFLSLLIIISVILVFTSNIQAAGSNRLFYNGKTYNLAKGVFSFDNEYFMDAAEVSKILGMKLEVDKPGRTVTISYKDDKKQYSIFTDDDSGNLPVNSLHNTPELINGKLAFPFSFINSTYNLTIKYNKDSGAVYILTSDVSGKLLLNSFSNLSYGYSLTLPDNFYLNVPANPGSFDDKSVSFRDSSSSLFFDITCDRLDNTAFQLMREYLNDYSSTDQVIFDKFIEYRKSFFVSLQNYYRKSFQYGSEDQNQAESNLKVFGEYNEKISGEESYTILYNTIDSDINKTSESTQIDIMIPVHSSMSIYSLHFSLEKGSLDDAALQKIAGIISSLRISHFPCNYSSLKIFKDRKSIASANSGIYPEPADTDITYKTYKNNRSGYSLSYPSTFIPYRENNIIDSYDYSSFKINYNHYFSILAEPVSGSKPISDKLHLLKELYGSSMAVTEEGTVRLDAFEAQFIKYKISDSQGTNFVQDYFISKGPTLYTIELNSKFVEPSSILQDEFLKIIGSLKFCQTNYAVLPDSIPMVRYENREEGYTFMYPSNWQLSGADNSDINYETLALKNPNLSGPVSITFEEGELSSYLLYAEPARFLEYETSADITQYFKKYDAPYLDRPSNILAGNYSVRGDTVYFTRLVNYQDEIGRSKYCYSVDAIRGMKSYSMFVTVSDYAAANRDLYGSDLYAAINTVSNSFSLETTGEYLQRRMQGESRNRRVVFIEQHFKKSFGDSAYVQSASSLTSANDILVNLNGTSEKGYYRVKLDYDGKDLTIVERMLKSDILSAASEELKGRYKNSQIRDLTLDESSMTLNIAFSSDAFSPVMNSAYTVTPELENGILDWKLKKKYDYDLLKKNCLNFIEKGLSPNLNAYFPSQSELAQVSSGNDIECYYVPVYTESPTSSGYFILGINPLDDSIDIISYTPIEEVYEKVRKDLSLLDSDFILTRSYQSESSKFEIKTIWMSAQKKEIRIRSLKIRVNQDSRHLEII
jgi:hypothetical protein